MRFSVIVFASGIVMALSFWCAPAWAGHGYYLHASVGRSQYVDGLQGWMMETGNAYGWERDGFSKSAWSVSGGIGKFIFENVSVGAQLTYGDADLEEKEGKWLRIPGTYTYTYRTAQKKIDTDIYEALVNVTVWIPRQTGLFMGVGFGISRSTVDLEYAWLSKYKWDGSGTVGELFSGFQITLDNELMLFSKFGYALRDFGTVEAIHAIEGTEPMEMDFSGWFVEIGFGGHTRRPWYPPK
jgi:hypothetical protein